MTLLLSRAFRITLTAIRCKRVETRNLLNVRLRKTGDRLLYKTNQLWAKKGQNNLCQNKEPADISLVTDVSLATDISLASDCLLFSLMRASALSAVGVVSLCEKGKIFLSEMVSPTSV
jgi:hypothetical protein